MNEKQELDALLRASAEHAGDPAFEPSEGEKLAMNVMTAQLDAAFKEVDRLAHQVANRNLTIVVLLIAIVALVWMLLA